MRPQHRSALFPYTTLFRSMRLLFAVLRRAYYLFIGSGHIIGTAMLLYAWKRMPLLKDRPWRIALTLAGAQTLLVTVLGDRKSTRLNSSHVEISYAVFCLKK